jgi:UDP-GlcNAc:undecaprenyl-phosphate GlcNAc-1-phosphate transferase
VVAPAHAALAALVCGACLGFLFLQPAARAFDLPGGCGEPTPGIHGGRDLAHARATAGRRLQYVPALGLALAVPLFETTFLVIVRSAHGMPWWRGSPDHFALRLQAAGLTAARTDLIAWGIAAALAGGACSIRRFEGAGQFGLVAGAAISLPLACAWHLLRLGPARRTSPARKRLKSGSPRTRLPGATWMDAIPVRRFPRRVRFSAALDRARST